MDSPLQIKVVTAQIKLDKFEGDVLVETVVFDAVALEGTLTNATMDFLAKNPEVRAQVEAALTAANEAAPQQEDT